MTTPLRQELKKLANEVPELRPMLVPVLAAEGEMPRYVPEHIMRHIDRVAQAHLCRQAGVPFDKEARGLPRRGQKVKVTVDTPFDKENGSSVKVPAGTIGTVLEVVEAGMPSAGLLDQMGMGAYDGDTVLVNFGRYGKLIAEEYDFQRFGGSKTPRLVRLAASKQAAMLSEREYDSLRPRQRIWFGLSTSYVFTNDDGMAEFEVGRKTYSKKYDVYSIRLFPIIDGKPHKGGAKFILFKREGGYISLSHGGMGAIVKNYRLASQKQASAVIVGDIFYSSWGYDQTNIDFYQVTGTTRTMVKLKKIQKKIVGGKGQPQEKVMPIPNSMAGPELRKKLKEYQGRAYVNLNSYASAYKWDGKPKSQTGGAYGH